MELILERFAPGEVFVAADFRDAGTRAMVNQALSRLARSGRITRLGAGLYAVQEISSYNGQPICPTEESIIAAFRRKNRSRYYLSAPRLANNYGLSEQVPVKDEFLTNGRSGKRSIGGKDLYFKRASRPVIDKMDRLPGRVTLALRYLGRRTSKSNARFVLSLMPKPLKQELNDYAQSAPLWMQGIIRNLP